MKRYLEHALCIAAAATALMMAASCGKDKDKPEPAIQITAGAEQTLWADQTDGATVTFTAAAAWTATVTAASATKAGTDAPAWISINPASGAAGSYTVGIALEENFTGDDRAAKITVACNGETAEATVTQKSTTVAGEKYGKKYDVYVGGGYVSPGASWGRLSGSDVYCKNGVTMRPEPFSNQQCKIADFAVAGNDVYTVGVRRNSFDGSVKALYAKNGVEIGLPFEGPDYSEFYGIEVVTSSGTPDVYIAGNEFIKRLNDVQGASVPVAKYWKNGVVYRLGDGVKHSHAWDIQVVGNDVYVLGNTYYSTNSGMSDLAYGYWKNGQFISITPPAGTSITEPLSMHVSGNNVYIACDIHWAVTDMAPGYWKNGQFTYLDDKKGQDVNGKKIVRGYVYGITVSGNDMYVAGSVLADDLHHYPVCWKNGEMTVLDTWYGYNSNIAGGVTVVDGNVYVAASRGVYKNGELFVTPDGHGFSTFDYHTIAVVPYSQSRVW